MVTNQMTFKLAGEAGQGVESSGAGFAKALNRAGLHVFGTSFYMSRIRGGHNAYQIRIAAKPLYTHNADVHILLPMNAKCIEEHLAEVVEGGAIIYDEEMRGVTEALENAIREAGVQPILMPLVEIAEEYGNKIMMNTAALGAAAGITGFDTSYMKKIIRENFVGKYGDEKGGQLAESNVKVLDAAFALAAKEHADAFAWKIEAIPDTDRLLLNGNEALALGAYAAGCRFMSAYPMTPASSLFEWYAQHAREYGIVAKQTESEIAAICMAIGANYVGARAMTATSGGGFALMVEALGLAGMTEVPLVIVEAQRAGPSTGMPTRTEQSDFLFVLHASQGEFPRIVLSPRTHEECFEAGARAFNLADRFQTPVLVLTDLFLASSVRSIERDAFDFSSVEIDRGKTLTEEELDALEERYARFKLTDDGISPRALPGHPNGVYISPSDEHTEYGEFESEDMENRLQQADKRARKLETARADMRPPLVHGPDDAELTFVGFGSTYGAIFETVELLNARDVKARMIHFADLWPLPVHGLPEIEEAPGRLIAVEQNQTGQLAQFLRTHTGRQVDDMILRYDGRQIRPDDIIAHLFEVKAHA